jgi:hypothetical protein
MDGAEALAARELYAPPGRDPEPVLLVVDRNHPVRAAVLGEEGIETVERGDVEHAHPAEVARKCGDAVAVIARNAGRIDARSAVEREGVKPERHLLDGRASDGRIDLDRQQVGHLPLGLGDDVPALHFAPHDRHTTEPSIHEPRSKPAQTETGLHRSTRSVPRPRPVSARRRPACRCSRARHPSGFDTAGIVPHNRFHHTAAGGATGRLRLDKDVISRRQSRDYPSVDSAPEGTLATPHRRAAEPQRDRAHRPLVAEPTAGRSEPVLVGGARCSGLRGR